jgi:Pyruvate/2-oxoacid:ferredoxin oxidoreductase delta subunit
MAISSILTFYETILIEEWKKHMKVEVDQMKCRTAGMCVTECSEDHFRMLKRGIFREYSG